MKTSLTLSTESGTETVTISAKLTAQGVQFPNDKPATGRPMLHNCFTITFKTERGKTSIKFYDSAKAFTEGVTELDESSLKSTLDYFVSDAIAGKQDFEEFCSELGYDTDSRTAERSHRACIAITKKAERIFKAELYDLSNALQAMLYDLSNALQAMEETKP